jgi:hypothetical protein
MGSLGRMLGFRSVVGVDVSSRAICRLLYLVHTGRIAQPIIPTTPVRTRKQINKGSKLITPD